MAGFDVLPKSENLGHAARGGRAVIGGESDERYFAGERYALEQFGEEHESPVQYADEKGDAPAAVSVIGIDSGCQRLYLADDFPVRYGEFECPVVESEARPFAVHGDNN